jgi:homoserine O-acetyltransferase/O-succinyltransferase
VNPSSTVDACCKPNTVSECFENSYLDLDCTIQIPTPFALDYGILEGNVSVKARLAGPENAPVILALGGISANRHVFDSSTHTQHAIETGWWRDFAGPGRVLDSQKFRLLSFDFLPGDELVANAPLTITPQDQARLARLICDYFGIQQLYAFVGSSYGGMVALSFGALFPEQVQQIVVACAAHRPHPMGTAWRSIQRKIVRFGLETAQPDRALSLARELGMTTYRTAQEFGERFSTETDCAERPHFAVEDYLETRGQAFIGKMTPHRYLSLSQSIDLHQVDPSQIHVPVTLIGFKQDQLVPIEEVRLLHAQLPQPRQCFEFDSIYGHDAFLKEVALMAGVLRHALNG